jgi:hypothetical protein
MASVQASSFTPCWYFAYGANMSTRVLERRGIRPTTSEAARLAGYRLAFDLPGLPFVEPAFASVAVDDASIVYGVLHLVSEFDLARLDDYESSRYVRRCFDVEGARSGRVEATFYVNPRPVRGLRPSRRYLGVLLDGAREHHLPDEYVRALGEQPAQHVPIVSTLATTGLGAFEQVIRASRAVARAFRG